VLGLAASALLVSANVLNRVLWHLPLPMGTHLPLSVFGLLMVVVLGVNPLLNRIRPRWRLTSGELAIFLAICLVACHVAGTGFLGDTPQLLSMPLQINQTHPGWRRYDLMSWVPPAMLVNGARYDQKVIAGLLSGIGESGETVSLSDIPWGAWKTPLTYWLTIILLMGLASVCLALIVHRQWSLHERLRYPIAEFTSSLIQQEEGRILGPIYRNKLFWAGLGVLMLVRMINYLHAWFPSHMQEIPLSLDFTPLVERWPRLSKAFVPHFIERPLIFPTAMAFAYFLSFEIGLSLWSSHPVFGITKLMLMSVGISTGTNFILGGWDAFTRFGGFVGTAAILLYTGRRYYGQVARRAIGLGGAERVSAAAGWQLRVVVLASVIVGVMFTVQGLDWPLSALSVLLLLIMFVVVARVSAEAGLFAFGAGWMPLSVLLGAIGGEILGIQDLFILGLLSMVLCLDTVESLMPYVVNSLKVGETLRLSSGSIGGAMTAGLVVILAVAVVAGLWTYYSYGFANDEWSTYNLPGRPFLAPYRTAIALSLTNSLHVPDTYGPLERLAKMQPSPRFVSWTLIGLTGVLIFSMLRLRFSWWPLHPVFVLIWGSWHIGVYSFSILLGWMIKVFATRLGGSGFYQKLKPMMMGLIAGDVLAAVIKLAVSTVYFYATGLTPPA